MLMVPNVRWALLSILLLLVLPSHGQQCTVCKDGDPVPFPDKRLNVNGIPVETCGDMEAAAGFLGAGTEFCDAIQAVGTLCGCPIEEGGCTLCSDGSRAPNATLELSNFMASDFLFGSPEGIPMTCESMEAYLHNTQENDAQCLSLRRQVAAECGCPRIEGEESMGSDPPTSSPAPSRTPVESCHLCPLGDKLKYPEKEIYLGAAVPVETCAELDSYAGLLVKGSTDCEGMQSLGYMCGCDAKPNACHVCPNGEPIPYPDKKLNWLTDYIQNVPEEYKSFGDALTCEIYDSTLKVPSSDLYGIGEGYTCVSAQLKSAVCGCSAGWRTISLTWTTRVASILSFLGSLGIIVHISRMESRRRNSTYHQMVLAISIFDMLSSTAYGLIAVMAPVEAGFHGSFGNNTTCKLQGFMYQLGQTSMFYNLALSLYFLLMICKNWKEGRFERLRKYVHAVVLLVGLGLAFASLPFIDTNFGFCYLMIPPVIDSWLPFTLIYSVPVSTVLALLTFANAAICIRVYRQQLTSRRWSSTQSMALTRRVFWQSVWYMLAFYLTIPLILVSYYWPLNTERDFITKNLLVAIFAPSQGTFNALVYFQRSARFDELVLKRMRRFSRRLSSIVSGLSTQSGHSIAKDSLTDDLALQRINSSFKKPRDDETEEMSAELSLNRIRGIIRSQVSETVSRQQQRPRTALELTNADAPQYDEPVNFHDTEATLDAIEEDCFEAARDYWRLNFAVEPNPAPNGIENSNESRASHEQPVSLSLRGTPLVQLRLTNTMEEGVDKAANRSDAEQ